MSMFYQGNFSNDNNVSGSLGGSRVERVHVQVPRVRESELETPRLSQTCRHLRSRGGLGEGETPEGLPA